MTAMAAPVFLTGFMGVGKSTVGLILAQRLGRFFFDTDQMVELRAGKSISEIFADEGEAHFRRLEHQCVRETSDRSDVVVALGGGSTRLSASTWIVAIVYPTQKHRPSAKKTTNATGIASAQ